VDTSHRVDFAADNVKGWWLCYCVPGGTATNLMRILNDNIERLRVNQSQNDLRSGCLMVFQIQLAGLVVIDF
jgi:hypothetical protein